MKLSSNHDEARECAPGPAMAETTAQRWTRKHLTSLEALSAEEIHFVLDTADSFKEVSTRSVKKVPALRGRVVVNAFWEDSTRTRVSFQLAAQRLSADTIDFSEKSSSVSKGETLIDTARNIEAMGVDVIVVRHPAAGAAQLLSRTVKCSIVNAGDGAHEHPTQGLLDLYTIRAVINELYDFGRPRSVDLAVLVDRGGRELPIQADFVGLTLKNVPRDHRVNVRRKENDGRDEITVEPKS
jgi:hypothetical protein